MTTEWFVIDFTKCSCGGNAVAVDDYEAAVEERELMLSDDPSLDPNDIVIVRTVDDNGN